MAVPCTSVLNPDVQRKDDSMLTPSYFPSLNAKAGTNKELQSVEVPLGQAIWLRSKYETLGLTAASIFQAAWALVLRCYLGNHSVCFASRIVRTVAHTDTFSEIHTDPSITHLDFSLVSSVLDILKRISGGCAESLLQQHDAIPCNTSLVIRQSESQDQCDQDGRAINTPSKSEIPESEIIVEIEILEDDFSVELKYARSILSLRSASNVASVYAMVIDELLADVHRPCDDINLLTRRDLNQIQSRNKCFPKGIDACVHQLLLEHATCTPQSSAICSWDGNLTYHELDMLTFRLACHFVSEGVKPQMLVPLCFQKSLYAILAMIAIHRAGAAFVPLDPTHPKDRLKAIIQRVNGKLVVASAEAAHLFHNVISTVIEVHSDMHILSDSKPDRTLPEARPEYPAFVLFTSGSTGQPKGILQEHGSVSTNALAHGRAMCVTSASRVFQFAAYTFDVSMMDIFTTLIYGGCVCIPSDDERKGSFTSIMNKMQVNWVLFTPSVASLITPDAIPSLKTMALGGEAVKQENVSRWINKVNLYNCYGPAECGACTIAKFSENNSRPLNIGRQYGSALCWVVDSKDHNRLLPIGAIGELLVEGPTLARGYLDDLPKTQSVFIKNPHWSQAVGLDKSRRLYKTGDLVRQNCDGSFEFIGRKDLQLKVRGQRVELGEVEHHLSNFPGIALALAALPTEGPYLQTLVGILQLQDSREPAVGSVAINHVSGEHNATPAFDEETLSQFLSTKLPGYMIPTRWLVVKKMPLSISGKIDRRMVDSWLKSANTIEEMQVASDAKKYDPLPKGNTIAFELCLKILALIGQSDITSSPLAGTNFPLVAVGLDSIKLISVVMFVRKRFGVRIQADVLAHPGSTILTISNVIEGLSSEQRPYTSEVTIDVMQIFRMYQQERLEALLKPDCVQRNVLVTGATGFLGSHIVHQLCKQTDIHRVIVHVRSASPKQAIQRVIKSAKAVGWCLNDYLSKIEAWPGDLAKPKLGLGSSQWRRLRGYGTCSERITAVIHNGAAVHWHASFASLKETNVDSTIDLLEAASQSSSLSDFVYVSGGQQLRVGDDDEMDIANEVAQFNGYAQTKFISELLVKEYARTKARDSQRISIVKPGYIIGTAEHGTAVAQDFIWRLTASCIDIKAYNADETEAWLFVSEVVHVANTITGCCLSSTKSKVPGSINLIKILDGIPVSRFWTILEKEIGYKLCPMQSKSWMEQLSMDIQSKGDTHQLWPLLQIIEKSQGRLGSQCNPRPIHSTDESRACAAIKKNVRYLIDTGFLPQPLCT